MAANRIGILVSMSHFILEKDLNAMKFIDENGEYAKSYCKQLYAI